MARKQTVAALAFYSDNGNEVTVSTTGTRAAPGSKIVSWILNWGDSSYTSSNGLPPTLISHPYLDSGTYTLRLDVTDNKGYTASAELILMLVRGPQPIVTSVYGPQPNIVCPLGAVSIPAGSTTASRQALINANPTGTSFCIASGLHTANGSNIPKSGQSFYGQYGAIIDGTGWASSDTTDAFFKAHLVDVDNVLITNLYLRNFPQRAIHAYYQFSDGWIVDYNEISNGFCGVSIPNSSFVRHNYIHHCTGDSQGGLIPNGAYIVSLAHDVLFEDNHFAFCGETQKVIDQTNNVTFRRNWIHDCTGPGIWFDGENINMLAEYNTVEDCAQGIMIEISGNNIIRNNIVRRSTLSGIFLSTTRDGQVYNNTIENCFRSINLFVNCPSVGGTFDHDLRNNSIYNNDITVPNVPSVLVSAISASDISCDATYTGSMGKNNIWTNNIYRVPAAIIGNSIWYLSVGKTFAQWQAFGEDVGSSLISI